MTSRGLLSLVVGAVCFSCGLLPTDEESAPVMPASLLDAANELGSSDDACIARTGAARATLASALEPQAAAIDGYLRGLPQDAYYRRVVVGPTYVRQLVNPLPAASPSSVQDWNALVQRLDAVQGTPTDMAWVSVNEATRSIFVDDWNRTMDHLDDSAAAAAARVKPGIVRPNDGVRRDGETFHVRLDPGPFAGSEDALRATIEPVWTNDSHRLVIDFVTNDPKAFRVLLDDGSGGRSFVRWSDKTVHLFPDVRERSIAHEIGHVLGFADHYEVTSRGVTC